MHPITKTILAILLILLLGELLLRDSHRQEELPQPPPGLFTVEGSLDLDEYVNPEMLQARLTVLGPNGEVLADQNIGIGELGTFRFREIPQGNATLSIKVSRDVLWSQTCASVSELHGLLVDPVDLKDQVHVFTFEVLDPLGEPAREVALFWRPALLERQGDTYELRTIGPSPRIVAAAHDVLDVAVLAKGARILELPAVAFSRTLYLRDGIPVRIALPDDIGELPSEVTLTVQLVPAVLDPRFRRAELRSGHIHQRTKEIEFREGIAELIVPEPGDYALHWRFCRELSGDALERVDLGSGTEVLNVPEDAHLKLFRPPFPEEDLLELLSRD